MASTTEPRRSLKEKWNLLMSKVTVEPILACYIMPSVLAALATQNLSLEKACLSNLGYGEEVCSALRRRETANYTEQETEVQRLVANVSAWKSALQSSIPVLLILFLGSWSDRHARRKPFLIMPMVGEFFSSLGLLLCVYYMIELPLEVAAVVEGLFPALSGGWMTMFMASFSYIGDVTTEKTRTLRMGVANVFVSLGIPIGTALSGVLLKLVGFYGMFTISSVLYMIGLLYGMLRLREARTPIPLEPGKGFLKDFFDLKHISETCKVAFRQREGNRRTQIILLMIMSIMLMGPFFGETSVVYLFTRYQFNWNELDFSFYATYCVIVNLIGTMLGIGVMGHLLKMDDSIIGVLACVSKIVASFLYALSTTELMFYMAPLLDIFSGCGLIAMRSMVSKLVPTEELGKVNSLIGVCEATAPFIYSPLYSIVYTRSIPVLPGAFFLLGSALTVPATFMFVWMYVLKRQEEKRVEQKESNPGTFKYKPNQDSKPEQYINQGFEKDCENAKM